MIFRKEIFFILFFFLIVRLNSSAQDKVIYSLDTSFFKNISVLTSSKLAEHPSTGNIYSTGQFIAFDSASILHQPYFINNLSNKDFTYIEDSSGFVISPFYNSGICFDDNDYIYTTGTVNDNKIICKTDISGNIIWNKRQGHHSFTDIFYHDGKLVLTGQDENAIGDHTIIISVIDTTGKLLNTKNYYVPDTFDNASKIIHSDNGYLLIGSALDNTTNSNVYF